MRKLADEIAEPKYAQIERERRWLVDEGRLPALIGASSVVIEDRYLDCGRLRVRRMTDAKTGEVSLKLSKKYDAGSPDARPMATAYLDKAEYNALVTLPGADLRERRYALPHEGRIWSLDIFEKPHAGLHLLEIEADAGTLGELVPPGWTTLEITHDPRFACGTLVRSSSLPE